MEQENFEILSANLDFFPQEAVCNRLFIFLSPLLHQLHLSRFLSFTLSSSGDAPDREPSKFDQSSLQGLGQCTWFCQSRNWSHSPFDWPSLIAVYSHLRQSQDSHSNSWSQILSCESHGAAEVSHYLWSLHAWCWRFDLSEIDQYVVLRSQHRLLD